MNKMSFTEEDKTKVVDFLNAVANKAKFEMNTQEIIDYFGLLAYMQKYIIPKIEANIVEVKRIIEPTPKEKSEESDGKKE